MSLEPTRKPQVSNLQSTITDYTLLHLIGKGGYGQVWLARTLTGERARFVGVGIGEWGIVSGGHGWFFPFSFVEDRSGAGPLFGWLVRFLFSFGTLCLFCQTVPVRTTSIFSGFFHQNAIFLL